MIDLNNNWTQFIIYLIVVGTALVAFGNYLISKKGR